MKQKRFNTEAEILTEIDKCHERARALMGEAREKENEIASDIKKIADLEGETQLRIEGKWIDPEAERRFLISTLPEKRRKQKRLEKSASNLIEKKAKRLGAALSAFRTQPMEAVLQGDCSVILQ